ncbi:transport and Golgi organization protein 1 homolog isoform X3 [Esox lucius]|uniref:transport and Golgi organization protein 1 homolog isoform X3 n=1 Tax=Esox lucius TaxID=8010 RepID=UPI001476BD06|nr:transport and Golgi organization protein 1 homolog isoform X3 [Esox lucius]
MAVNFAHVYFFILFIQNLLTKAAAEKRFSDFKRCADEECSMLLCRGKASNDFVGPDCRFLSFKKGETIYVYYKLSGRRTDIWAGSVGNRFGYFHKDLLAINHIYTDKELEIPAEETDFVCFDTGYDKFDNYDIDSLLVSSLLLSDLEESVKESVETLDLIQSSVSSTVDTEVTLLEKKEIDSAVLEDIKEVVSDQVSVVVPDQVSAVVPDQVSAVVPDQVSAVVPDQVSAVVPDPDSEVAPDPDSEVAPDPDSEVAPDPDSEVAPDPDSEVAPDPDSEVAPDPDSEVAPDPDSEVAPDPDSEVESSHPETILETLDTVDDSSLVDDSGPVVRSSTVDDSGPVVRSGSVDDSGPVVGPGSVDDSGPVVGPGSVDDSGPVVGPGSLDDSGPVVGPGSVDDSGPVVGPGSVDDSGPVVGPGSVDDSGPVVGPGSVDDSGPVVGPGSVDDSGPVVGSGSVDDSGLVVGSGSVVDPRAEELMDELQKEKQKTEPPVPASVVDPEKGDTKESLSEPLSVDPVLDNAADIISEGRILPKLKTTLGATFDAVTTDDEDTWKVTPYDEEDKKSTEFDYQQDKDSDYHLRETPLLAFSEERSNLKQKITPDSDQEDGSSEIADQNSNDKNMWSSFGDTVFKIVSGGERTPHVPGSEEEDDEDEDEEGKITTENLPKIEKSKENIQLLTNDPEKEPEETEQLVIEKPVDVNFGEGALKASDKESQMLLFEEESEEEDIKPSTPPADEVIPFENTEEASVEKLSLNDNPVPKQLTQTEILSDFDSNAKEVDQKSVVEELPIKEKASRDFSQVENKLKLGDTMLSRQFKELKAPDQTENTESHQGLPIEEEEGDVIDDMENEEELLEDENAALSASIDDKYKESTSEYESEQPSRDNEVLFSDEAKEAHDIVPEDYDTDKYLESTSLDQSLTPPLEGKVWDPVPEPEYSDDVLRLTLLRDHFSEDKMESLQKILGLQHLFRLEFLFSDLEQELKAARLSQTNTSEDIDKALEAILEASETPILDEVERMLDTRDNADQQVEAGEFDEEAAVLDDFQELAFTLRQKYSAASDSAPLAAGREQGRHPDTEKGMPDDLGEEKSFPLLPEDNDEENITVTETREETKAPEEKPDHDEGLSRPDMGFEEDVGHFNRNKDNQPSFKTPEEIQRGPQPILENTLDVGLVDMENPSARFPETPPVSDFHEEEQSGSSFSSVIIFSGSVLALVYEYLGIYAVTMIQCLPEEWKPGPDFYGVSWEPVVVTACAGLVGFLFLFWRSVLSVKSKSYLTSEKEMIDKMRNLEQEKKEILQKVAELQQQGEELKEQQELSEKSSSSSLQKIRELESLVQEMERQNERLKEEKNLLSKNFDEERTNAAKHEDQISEMDKTIEKLKHSRKKTQDALLKATVRIDEAKLREDARSIQHQVLEKDITCLREENQSLQRAAKSWEEKHREMSEQIRAYQKSQKELEDSVAQKDHNIEVLSDLLGDLEACDDLKGGVSNGDASNDKQAVIRNRVKQMMDVSRVQTTLSVVEEERDRFMTKLLNEEKARKQLEEQYQKLEHEILVVKGSKNHLENQYKTLQQKNEIMTEMYQQKENALQQKLTKEEFERRNKEVMLTEVDGKAMEAEEELKVCRRRIKEIQEELKQTEKSYKAQIIEQEQKSHENWVMARAAERALLDEKKETTNLRNRLTEMSSKLNELRRPLFKPTPGMASMPLRRGDSYGPSPVSGGAPSPPLMIEGPGRPPSAPVGRRNEPYGPRPPSDPHGRYLPDHNHPVAARPDPSGPRTSSPSNLDGSNSGPQGPVPMLVSPISSGLVRPLLRPPSGPGYRPPPGPGPHLPPPPPFMYRQPNGPPGMMLPGAPPPNGHPPGPMMPLGQRPPPLGVYGPPPPQYGPMPPPFGVRGGPLMPRPTGPPRPYSQYGPRDHSIPPQNLPPGTGPYPPQGSPRDLPGPPPQGHDFSADPRGQGHDYSSQQPPQGQGQDYSSQQPPQGQGQDYSSQQPPQGQGQGYSSQQPPQGQGQDYSSQQPPQGQGQGYSSQQPPQAQDSDNRSMTEP